MAKIISKIKASNTDYGIRAGYMYYGTTTGTESALTVTIKEDGGNTISIPELVKGMTFALTFHVIPSTSATLSVNGLTGKPIHYDNGLTGKEWVIGETYIFIYNGTAFVAISSYDDYTVTVTGSGNAITSISKTGRSITATKGATFIKSSEKGTANGVATLDSTGKVPTAQLPSYVDDVLEYTSKSNLPSKGETGKIYVVTEDNKTYRWSGSDYVEISASLALGETSSTAYPGDKGKANAAAIASLQSDKVDKVSGKGLSTNDYTTTEKNKLSGIAAGAEVNVQSDWNETSTTSDAYIKNKPNVITKTAGASAKFVKGDGSLDSSTYLKTITTQSGTNINKVGTPSVTASTSGNSTTLTFDYLKGATGAQGYQGITGLQGTKGLQGTTGLQGYQGTKGYQGYRGVQGYQGYKGDKGDTGGTGATGVGVTGHKQSTTSTADGGKNVYTINYSDGTSSTITLYNGTKGTTGAKGNTGDRGVQGYQGITGLQGTAGLQGYQGRTGTATQGYQGLQGYQGRTGLQGTAGKNGTNGTNGTNGLQGYQGYQGKAGPSNVIDSKYITDSNTYGLVMLPVKNGTLERTPTTPSTGEMFYVKGENGGLFTKLYKPLIFTLPNGTTSTYDGTTSITISTVQGYQGYQGYQGKAGKNGTNGTNGSHAYSYIEHIGLISEQWNVDDLDKINSRTYAIWELTPDTNNLNIFNLNTPLNFEHYLLIRNGFGDNLEIVIALDGDFNNADIYADIDTSNSIEVPQDSAIEICYFASLDKTGKKYVTITKSAPLSNSPQLY